MAKNSLYLAVGVEAARGIAEVTTVGFLPTEAAFIPKFEPEVRERGEYRGAPSALGENTKLRMSKKWSASLETPFFTEAGTAKGIVGSLLRHFFGGVSSAQQAATTAYAHMMYAVEDPFAAANLDDDALTFNVGINEGSTMKNWPFVGSRVKSLSFEQEMGMPLKVSAELFGQFRDTVTAELGSVVFPAENLRCDYNNMAVYEGTPSRTGSAPDYTDIDPSGGDRIKVDKITVKVEDGKEDVLRGDGNDYPTLTRMNGRQKVTIELTIDWQDPSSGFSSIDELNAWYAAEGSINLCIVWDTGTEAGTAYNHKLVLDIPRAQRMGGDPEYDIEKDPMITLNYEGLFDDTTTQYMLGCLLQNSVTAI